MNRWGMIATCVLMALAYSVGWQHSRDKAVFEVHAATVPPVTTVASPHASVCAAMLEAAWSIKDKDVGRGD